MGFLRRLLGQGGGDDPVDPAGSGTTAQTTPPGAAPSEDATERAYELELAREEQERADDLVRRQQRYAAYAWTPPPEGGDRRADDEDAGRE